MLYILATVIPWKHVQVRVLAVFPAYDKPMIELQLPNENSPYSIRIAYPPLHTFQTYAFWMTLLHWSIPTLIIPAVVGNIVSFHPSSPQPPSSAGPPVPPFDPLTASIVRLAAQVGYPFVLIEQNTQILGLDVLGFKWRVLNASVALAFSFAEAIASAPQVVAKTLAVEQQYDRLLKNGLSEDEPQSNRKALMGPESHEPNEEYE